MKKCNHPPSCLVCLRKIYVDHAQEDVSNYPLRCWHPSCTKVVRDTQLMQHNLIRSPQQLDRHYSLHLFSKTLRRHQALRIQPGRRLYYIFIPPEEWMIKTGIRQRRRCGSAIQKAEGCLKMKCRCGYRFCFSCGSENAQCNCTPCDHGFIDNITGYGDFEGLHQVKSYT